MGSKQDAEDLSLDQGRIEGGFLGFQETLLTAKHFKNNLPQ